MHAYSKMVKSSIKALKKAKIQQNGIKHELEGEKIQNGGHDDDTKKSPAMALGGKELRQNLISESAYITDLLSIVNFPKREDSDDEDGKIIINIIGS